MMGAASNNCPLDFMKALDEKDGVLVYEITKTQFENIQDDYIVTVSGDTVSTSKGSKAIAKENEEKERNNNAIYDAIGKQEQRKAGKQSVGASTAKEDAQIAKLQL